MRPSPHPSRSLRRWSPWAVAVLAAALAAPAAWAYRSDAFLGISSRGLSGEEARRMDLPSRDGALIQRVYRDTAADKAGLERGDVIIEFDGHRIFDDNDLTERILDREPGDRVSILIRRDGDEMELKATLGSRRDQENWDDDSSWGRAIERVFGSGHGRRSGPMLGVHVMEMGHQLADYFEAPDGGVLVTKVVRRSAAEEAGIQAGDVIVKVDDSQIYEPGDIGAILHDRWGETVSVEVLRKGRRVTLEAALDED